MVHTAKTEAAKAVYTATGRVAELGNGAADKAIDLARDATNKVEDTARRGREVVQSTAGAVGEVQREVAHRSAEGMAQFGQALVDLLKEQTQHNLETLTALTGAVDWRQVAKGIDWNGVVQIQSEYTRVSLERTARFTKRYLEVTQTVMTVTSAATQGRANKAA